MPSPGTSKERGYDHKHRKLRDQIKASVDAGQTTCWRCGIQIHKGEPWDLGHDDDDRTKYRGPEHQACNRSTRSRQTIMTGPPVDTTRDW